MKAWRDLQYLPQDFWILCFSSLVNRMGTMALPFLALYLTRSLGLSAAQSGITLAVYGTVAFLVGPFAGKLSDRWGALYVMETSLLGSGLALLLFPLAHSWEAVLLMTILFAATNEAFRPANLALISELAPAHYRQTGFAASRLAVNLGMSIGPTLGGMLAQKSFPLLFLVDGGTTLAAMCILAFSPFHPHVKAREQKRQRNQRELGPKISKVRKNLRWRSHPLLSDSYLFIFLLGLLPVSIVFWQHQSSMPLFLVRDLRFSEASYGTLFAVNTLMIITMEIPINSVTAQWPYRRILSLGAILFALGFGGLALARTYWEVAATVAIWTFGEMILFPSMSSYVSEISPDGKRGEYLGFYMMAFSFAFMIGPWIGTAILQRHGPTILWSAALALGLISAAIFAQVKNGRKS